MNETLPKDWKVIRFGNVAIHVNERVAPSQTDLDKYVGLEHLDSDSLRIRRWGAPSDVIGEKLRVRPGDVVFGKRRAYQRKLAIAEFDCICSAHAMILRPNESNIRKDFFPFFLQSDSFMERALEISVGSLSPTINWGTLKNQEFVLPPLIEQKRMAEILWAVESSIWKTEDAIGVAELYFRILMAHLFSSGPTKTKDDYECRRKLTDWKAVKLTEVVDFVMGQSPPGNTYNDDGEGVPFLQGSTEFGDLHPTHGKYTTQPIKFAKKGDVLLSVRAPVGDINIADMDYCIGRGLGALTLKEGNNRYLYYLLLFLREKISRLGAGSTFKAITRKTLEDISISYPPSRVRNTITDILDRHIHVIESLKREDITLKEQKSIMLSQLLRGKVRLKGMNHV